MKRETNPANPTNPNDPTDLKACGGPPALVAPPLSEARLQSECFQWAWNGYPETRRLLAHVPNGGGRNAREGMALKAAGVVAGVHDMFFYWKGQLYWFELKVGRNILSHDQVLFRDAMTAQGAICHEIRDKETFQSIFKSIIL